MKLFKKCMPFILFAAILIFAACLYAQENNGKKALTFDDYARWRSVTSTSISDDGNWITFGYSRREADDTLYVRNLENDKLQLIPLASRPQFSDDGKWIAYVEDKNLGTGGG